MIRYYLPRLKVYREFAGLGSLQYILGTTVGESMRMIESGDKTMVDISLHDLA